MSGVKWTVEVDNNRECYRILTEAPVMEHDGVKEQQWIAEVFEQSDAIAITNTHNAALDINEENGSSHNTGSPKLLNELEGLLTKTVFPKIQQAWQVADIIKQLRAGA